jgi:two-component system sensor histidine kinase RegB
MGLGLFIAKTLLERTGARLTFANAAGGGALVVVCWPRAALAPPPGAAAPRARGPETARGAAP